MSENDRLEVANVEGVTTVTFNRPDRLNAFDAQMVIDFDRELQALDGDTETRVVVLTGAGRAFTAGGDVKSFGSMPDHRVRRRGARLVDTMLAMETPVIAKVNGPAIGLGLTIALLSDCILIAEDAQLGDPHVNLGAVAGDGVAFILPAIIGPHRAKELLMTGRSITGLEAADMGLVNRAVPSGELDAAVAELAALLVKQPAYALRATKATINRYAKSLASDMLDVALAYEEISRKMPEHGEAVESWKGRRA